MKKIFSLMVCLLAVPSSMMAANEVRQVATLQDVVAQRATAGADVNAKGDDGCTALMRASYDGHKRFVRRLLRVSNIDVNAKGDDRRTALMCAAIYGHENIVMMLLAAGADVNVWNNGGNTALMFAAQNGHENIVRILLDVLGIDVNKQNEQKKTALDMARYKNYSAIIKHLEGPIKSFIKSANKN